MPRPRTKKYKDLPEGLYFKNIKGYVFLRVDGTSRSLGHDKSRAISMARHYNATFRVDLQISHVVNQHKIKSKLNKSPKPLSVFFSRLLKRYKEEELPSSETFEHFQNRLKKLNEMLGNRLGVSIVLEDVNQVLQECAEGRSNLVYNDWISFMSKVFDYALDESVMLDNPAKRKKRKPKDKKLRQRLTLEEYKAIRSIAPSWLTVAMDLSLETTHAVNEICSIRYEDIEFLEAPVFEDGLEVFAFLKIHRQKTKAQEASRVVIPVTSSLFKTINESRDEIISPYVVHRWPDRVRQDVSKHCEHLTQINRKYLSRKFSYYRDLAGVKGDIPKEERPTFHEIRGLAIFLYDKAGYNPQSRAAHSDSRSTEIYKKGHEKWVQIQAAEIGIRSAVPI